MSKSVEEWVRQNAARLMPETHFSDGRYILNDVVTIEWDNGQTAKFHYKHLRG